MEEYYQKIKEKKQKYITNKIIATKKNMEKIAIKFSRCTRKNQKIDDVGKIDIEIILKTKKKIILKIKKKR